MTRSRSRRFLQKSLAIASAVGFLMTAGVASAHGGDRHRERSYRTYDHGDNCRSRSSHRHQRRSSYNDNNRYERRQESYYCDPCSQRFQSRKKFHRHLSHHHRVPLFALPFVIVKSTLGWIFHG